MSTGLSLIEQETIITYNRKEDWVEIATRIPRDITKLKKLEKSGEVVIIDGPLAGYVRYKMPLKSFTWNRKKKVVLSEKQKKARSEHLKRARDARLP